MEKGLGRKGFEPPSKVIKHHGDLLHLVSGKVEKLGEDALRTPKVTATWRRSGIVVLLQHAVVNCLGRFMCENARNDPAAISPYAYLIYIFIYLFNTYISYVYFSFALFQTSHLDHSGTDQKQLERFRAIVVSIHRPLAGDEREACWEFGIVSFTNVFHCHLTLQSKKYLDSPFHTPRKDGLHFWGGPKYCIRCAYVKETPGRALEDEFEELASFSDLILGTLNTLIRCLVLKK